VSPGFGELHLGDALILAQRGDARAELLEEHLLVLGHGVACSRMRTRKEAHNPNPPMRNAVDYTPKWRKSAPSYFVARGT
jgi:hypothetical protein